MLITKRNTGTESSHPTPYALHATPCTLHPTPYTLHPTPCTLHPTPYTPHPTPCTLHPSHLLPSRLVQNTRTLETQHYTLCPTHISTTYCTLLMTLNTQQQTSDTYTHAHSVSVSLSVSLSLSLSCALSLPAGTTRSTRQETARRIWSQS